ncbi:MAG: Mur ligase family protein, partial [Proteobacteria bacterium]|nr:Mur ligase family protein [Pseudomonadota bacterium]
MKVHFVGINGSGCSGVAIAAAAMGFDVDGCDRDTDTPYAAQVRAAGIPVIAGHDAAHANDADIVAATPAATGAEIDTARDAGKFMTWQSFLGKYILPKRRVVAVCGTHGKTTTSALMAHVMMAAGMDPTAFIGAIIPDWNASNRIGASDWLVLEADEYANNFAPYHPQYIILNNLEMEHPEFFRDFDHYRQTFRDFLSGASDGAVLVYNADDPHIPDVLDAFAGEKIPFGIRDTDIRMDGGMQRFDGFATPLLGRHNVSNCMAAVTMARRIGIDDDAIESAMQTFRGAGHRLEKIVDQNGVTIYDDYAHHHTQAARTIAALRAAHPEKYLLAIYEPHQISRYVQNTDATLAALSIADTAVITEFWRGREAGMPIPDVAADLNRTGIKNIVYLPNTDAVASFAIAQIAAHPNIAIGVMGAGKSY